MQAVAFAWLIVSSLAVPVLLYRWCCAARTESTARSRVFAMALLLLIWLHPFTQRELIWGPLQDLADELERRVGSPMKQVVAEYGEPRTDRPGSPYYTASTWYAPLSVLPGPSVRLLSFDRRTLDHVSLAD